MIPKWFIAWYDQTGSSVVFAATLRIDQIMILFHSLDIASLFNIFNRMSRNSLLKTDTAALSSTEEMHKLKEKNFIF